MKYFRVMFVFCLSLIFGCSTKKTANKPNSVPKTIEQTKVHLIYSARSINNKYEEIDLDGNGTKDKILFVKSGGDDFILTVNNISVKGEGDNLDGIFNIVDIDTKDNIKEIAIPESGPSYDYKTAFYYYDGKRIIKMGKVQGSTAIKIDGSGIIIARTRGSILHTWFYNDPYKLTKQHLLKRIPKGLYEMNCKVKVEKTLALKKSRTNSKTALILQPGEEVTILSCDNKEWCLVENKKGAQGWFAIDGYDEIRGTNLSASKFFNGLSYAD